MAETPEGAGPSKGNVPSFLDEPFVEPPRWPKVIGTLSMVWGGLGLTCGACGIVMVPMIPAMMGKPDMPLPPTMQFDPLQMGLFAVGCAQAVLLIVAGVLTYKYKLSGRRLHLIYAILTLLLLPISMYLSWRKQALMGAWVQDNPDSPFAKGYKPGAGYIGLAFGFVMGGAWPTFVLIWFGLVKRSLADMIGRTSPVDQG